MPQGSVLLGSQVIFNRMIDRVIDRVINSIILKIKKIKDISYDKGLPNNSTFLRIKLCCVQQHNVTMFPKTEVNNVCCHRDTVTSISNSRNHCHGNMACDHIDFSHYDSYVAIKLKLLPWKMISFNNGLRFHGNITQNKPFPWMHEATTDIGVLH